MSAANVIAFPTDAEVDLEQVHARAGSLDFLAELVDNVVAERLVDADPHLAERMRELGDELVDLACRPNLDVLAINQALARSSELLREATDPICRSSTRRMLGAPLYERIADAVLTLGELGAVAFDRAVDDDRDDAAGIAPMRRFTRVIASAYDWAQWNVDAPVALRGVLVDALDAAAATASDEVDITHELAPTDGAPLAGALDELLHAWLTTVPGDVLAEYATERERLDDALHGCFDLGVACSIARRILHAATGAPVPDSAGLRAWRMAP
jgi:hypothetical protein